MNRLIINADRKKGKIDRNIYGHFAEHLGRCIYEGFWVGEESPIPNTRGIRKDVVEALRKIRVPVLRGGRLFADQFWQDGIGPRRKADFIPTRVGYGKQPLWHPSLELRPTCRTVCGNVGRQCYEWNSGLNI